MLPIKERLNNSQVVRVYRQMIENSDIEIVQNLRQNLREQAPDHPRTKDLEVFFKQRLGE
jgi:hypothetical protein